MISNIFINSTNRQTLLCIAMALAILFVLSGHSEAAGGFRLCGQKLTRMLIAICRNELCGGYFSPRIDKRSLIGEFHDTEWHLPLMDNAVKRGGVATECCVHRCTYSYLKTFCCDDEMANE